MSLFVLKSRMTNFRFIIIHRLHVHLFYLSKLAMSVPFWMKATLMPFHVWFLHLYTMIHRVLYHSLLHHYYFLLMLSSPTCRFTISNLMETCMHCQLQNSLETKKRELVQFSPLACLNFPSPDCNTIFSNSYLTETSCFFALYTTGVWKYVCMYCKGHTEATRNWSCSQLYVDNSNSFSPLWLCPSSRNRWTIFHLAIFFPCSSTCNS